MGAALPYRGNNSHLSLWRCLGGREESLKKQKCAGGQPRRYDGITKLLPNWFAGNVSRGCFRSSRNRGKRILEWARTILMRRSSLNGGMISRICSYASFEECDATRTSPLSFPPVCHTRVHFLSKLADNML